jgi:SAM-dependent methyltransferase
MENEIQKSNIICLACGGDKNKQFFEKNGFNIRKCNQCLTWFVNPIPSKEQIDAVYGSEYFSGATKGFGYVDYDFDKEAMKKVFTQHILDFERLILGRDMFDIGAATGYFLLLAKARGWNVSGIEISKDASQKARNKGLDIITGTLSDTNIQRNFDVVTMWDVIEHMRNPEFEINLVNKILKPGGLLAINTPDSYSLIARILKKRWHLVVPPEHIWYFNKKSLSLLLERNGFKILKRGCVGKKFTIEYILQTLYRWQKLSIWKYLLDRVKGKSIGQISIPINLRDNMYILAKKI